MHNNNKKVRRRVLCQVKQTKGSQERVFFLLNHFTSLTKKKLNLIFQTIQKSRTLKIIYIIKKSVLSLNQRLA